MQTWIIEFNLDNGDTKLMTRSSESPELALGKALAVAQSQGWLQDVDWSEGSACIIRRTNVS